MSKEVAVQLRNLSKKFSSKVIFENLNLNIEAGHFVTILGSSGGGKSTLLRLISGLDIPTSGNIELADELRTSLSYVFQDSNLLPWKTVEENIRLVFEVGIFRKKYSVTQANEQVLQILKKVHLTEAAQLFPHQLSGGMKMRVSLARAMVTSPKLLLMDEPFAALDEVTRFEMQNQLLELWQSEKMTVIFVTHSLFEAAYLSQKVVLLKKPGHIAEIELDLPAKRDESLRNSEQMIRTVQDLSERLRT